MTPQAFKTSRKNKNVFVVSSNQTTPYKLTSKKNVFFVHQPKTKSILITHNNSNNNNVQNHITKETHLNLINKPKLNEAKFKRRFKFRFSITKPNHLLEKKLKKVKELKAKHKRNSGSGSINGTNKKECSFEIGRWKLDEHQRFVEAIIKYGNDWKQVQKCVRTRSSTQARSHAQKFFIKIKKAKLLSFNLDLSKSSIKMFHDLIADMTTDEYEKILQDLNDVAFDRKGNSLGKRRKSQSKSIINSDSTDQDLVGTTNKNEIYDYPSQNAPRSRRASLELISERRKNRNSINSIEGFYNYNSANNFLFEEKGEKILVYDHENNTTINDKDYANNFNLAFRSDNNKNLFDNDNEDENGNFHKKTGKSLSQEDDFLFNYMMH